MSNGAVTLAVLVAGALTASRNRGAITGGLPVSSGRRVPGGADAIRKASNGTGFRTFAAGGGQQSGTDPRAGQYEDSAATLRPQTS